MVFVADSGAARGKETGLLSGRSRVRSACTVGSSIGAKDRHLSRRASPCLRSLKPPLRPCGFTMIEVVVVLIVLGIITTVVATSYRIGANNALAETEGVKASLRFAQLRAMTDESSTWGIHFQSSATYRLYKNDVDASATMLPVKDQFEDPVTLDCPKNCHALSGNVQIASAVVGKTINFDQWGRPMDGTNLLAVDFTIGMDQTNTVTITKNTGYIP